MKVHELFESKIPIVGKCYKLANNTELGDYSNLTVLVEKGPRGTGKCEQYRVSWGSKSYEVDWIETAMFKGSTAVKEPAGLRAANPIYIKEDFSDTKLLSIARKAGEKMYGNSHSGLVFSDKIYRITYADYISSNGDAGAVVGTYDFIFFPSSGKGMEAADQRFSKKFVDIDGKIYIAGADGVYVLDKPFVKAQKIFAQKEFEEFKTVVLKHFPVAIFKKRSQYHDAFAYSDGDMVGQFLSYNTHTSDDVKGKDKPAWIVYKSDSNHKLKVYSTHNWS